MFGYVYGKGLILFRKESIFEGIKLMFREKFWEMNFRVFERGVELLKE